MAMIGTRMILVRDASAVGEARRAALQFAQANGFEEEAAGRIALIGTEMATNLVHHGGGGHIAMDRFADQDGAGIELLALDSGPGMADVARCLTDGYSTAGSPGTGLGAIARQSDGFGIYSRPGKGTVVMARFVSLGAAAGPRAQIGAIRDCYPGESVCGDNWCVADAPGGLTMLLVDGSGHGPQAAEAAAVAMRSFGANLALDCVPLVEAVHRALAPTRGAAIAVARIDRQQHLVRFVGVGNIAAMMVSGGSARRLASHNGTAGHIAPRIREFTYPFAERPLLIMHSDGLTARWEIDAYPGLAGSHPSLVAGVLFRDHRRGRDDATVAAMRGAL